MRILKHGTKPSEEKQVTCGKCKTIFTFEPKDVHSDQRDGNYVICPTCETWINSSLGIEPLEGIRYE